MQDQVIEIFAQLTGRDAADITVETRLDEDLELKSLDKFALLAMLEAALGKAPDPNLADPWNTVGEWAAFYEA